jgi:hypothetical protein
MSKVAAGEKWNWTSKGVVGRAGGVRGLKEILVLDS